MSALNFTRVGPATTIQDEGRPGMLVHGIAASGPIDRHGYRCAERSAGLKCGASIEFTASGLSFVYEGKGCVAGFGGGAFRIEQNGVALQWPGHMVLSDGDVVDIRTGPWGNYGYLRFDKQLDVPFVLGSQATNAIVGIGGLDGRALQTGDRLSLRQLPDDAAHVSRVHAAGEAPATASPIRFIWGIHASLFPERVRQGLEEQLFVVSSRMNRMGVTLKDVAGVFAQQEILSLVSDPVLPGDIQILGNGVPIVLLRDHQPTGGYPRIGTIIDADIDRFAQIRPGGEVRFMPVTVNRAHAELRSVR